MSELAHGILLQEQGRLEEAEACFRNVLIAEPENDFVYNRLALCLFSQKGKKKLALETIDEAIRLQPDTAFHYSVKAMILSDLRRGREALEIADIAIALNPEDSFALATKAQAYCSMDRWAEGEEWSRKALSVDGDHRMAANLLTHALRMQGKSDENEAAVKALLAADPEDSRAHINAGWSALQRRDHTTAETHFREALRLEPESGAAREGLLESFRARSLFYRAYLSYTFFLQRFTAGRQWMIILGLYLAFQLTRLLVKSVSPLIGIVLGCAWIGLVMWVWLSPGIGNFLILLDRSARLALGKGERWQGMAVGGGLIAGLLATGGGIASGYDPAAFAGIGMLAATIPASLGFGNESRAGRLVFGAITAFVCLATLVVTVLEGFRFPAQDLHTLSIWLGPAALIASLLSTWLGNFRQLRWDVEG